MRSVESLNEMEMNPKPRKCPLGTIDILRAASGQMLFEVP